ncbi:MAG: iron uptake porin, partial [Cyanobacteriota bacterium]|nr:iron uptake porin [Cyanobacteriota bacterium]
ATARHWSKAASQVLWFIDSSLLPAALHLAFRAVGLLPLLLVGAITPLAPSAQASDDESINAGDLPLPSLQALAKQWLVQQACTTPEAASPTQFQSGTSASRYALAAAVQLCLDRSAGPSTDLQRRVMQELGTELAALKGRVETLQKSVDQLEATRFSPTTRLRGLARWYLGGLGYYGNQIGPNNTYSAGRPFRSPQTLPLQDAVTLSYDLQLNLDTSFSGKDLLRTRLRAGNGAFSGLRGNLVTPMVRLDGVSPFCSIDRQLVGDCRNNILTLDKLFYRTPLGSGFTVVVGPRLTQKDMLGVWPALYGSSERILSAFDYAGAVGAYSDVKGTGLGFNWKQPGNKRQYWVVSAVYVAAEGAQGAPSLGGLFTDASRGAASLQLGYVGRNWSVAGIYTYNQAGARQDEIITPLSAQTWPANRRGLNGSVNSFGLSGYWDPTSISDWIPAVSVGWGFNQNVYNVSGPYAASPFLSAQSQSWMVAMEWKDVLEKGNNFGLGIAQPKFLTSFTNRTGQSGAYDSSWIFEAWYKIQITDAIALTPALFWLPRPRGQLTQAGSTWTDAALPTSNGATLGVFGLVLKATFRF